ncbi:MAG: hypothetical protein Q7J84_14785 [Sulfuricaulis sp.]|nr:hypothetical protein [Sulfuricaulis sp.]
MTTPRVAAQIAISVAGFTAATERNAMRLLARAAEENGHVAITLDALCRLFDVKNPAVTRRHLGLIQAAGIIHYSTNQDVYINFRAWPARVGDTETVIQDHLKRAPTRADDHEPTENTAPERAPTRADDPAEDPQRAPDLLKARVGDTESARGRAHGGDNRGGRLVGINYFPLPGENLLPTNQPVNAHAPKLAAWEAEASEGLLLALGCENLPTLRTLAATVTFEEIRAHALAWQRDPKTTGPGGLLHRIRSADFALPELTDDDRRSSLFLRHRTPAEIAADEQRQAAMDAHNAECDAAREQDRQVQPAVSTSVAPGPTSGYRFFAWELPEEPDLVEAKIIWQHALDDLALSMPAPTYETWVRDTNVLSYEPACADRDGKFVIGVPHAYARDWLQKRLRPQVKRILSRLLQRSTEVTFAVRPRPNPNGDQ